MPIEPPSPPAPASRWVLVTGSSRGIGQAIALQLARDGFDIVLHCRTRRAEADATLAAIHGMGRAGRVLQFDIGDRPAARIALEADLAAHGPYYGLVCNAGICRDAPFPAMTDDAWDDVIRTNLDGFYNIVRPVVMPMVQAHRGGRIVTLSSVSGLAGQRGQVNYSAAKAGIIGATKALAEELAKRKITVNCVAPGFIDTEMLTGDNSPFAASPAGNGLELKELTSRIPMRRLGTPAEVASLVGYLFSDAAGYLTRQVIAVNGGIM